MSSFSVTVMGGAQPVAVHLDETAGATVTNIGTADVLYATTAAVRTSPDGTLTAGSSATLYGTVWLYAASRTDMQVSPLTVESDNLAGGNLGATHTLNVAGRSNRGLEGTLTANLALTVTNLPAAGRSPLLLTQDGTGGRTLTVNGTAVDNIPSDPGDAFVVWLLGNEAGTDFYVQVPGAQGPPGPQGATGGTGLTGEPGATGAPGSTTPDDGTVTNAKVAVGANIAQSKLATLILPEYDKDNVQAGMYAPEIPMSVSLSGLTAGRRYVVRFVPSRDMTIAKMAFVVSTAAGADDACDVGIFSANLATLLGSKGATTGLLNSTGAKVVTLGTPVALTKHTVYYAAFSVGTFGGTAASLVMASWASGGASQMFGTTGPATEMAIEAAGHPLTAPVTPAQSSLAPLFALRES